MFRFKTQSYDNNIYMKWIFYAYCGLMMNLGMLILNLPFFIVANFLAIAKGNLGVFLMSTLLFYPAIISMLAVMDRYRIDRDIAPFKNFFTIGLKQFGLKGFKYGVITTVILIILFSDIQLFYHLPFAKFSVPFLVVLCLSTIILAINMMYFRVRNPKASEKSIFRIAFYYLLRKWYVSLLTILLLGAMLATMVVKPQFGFLLTPALLIGIIFLNCTKLHQEQ